MRLSTPLAVAWVALVALSGAPSVGAEGWNLDGRMAPDLVFPAGTNGVSPGTSLASFQGKVVVVKFWLRDCPLCRKTLPALQDLHARWGGSGLVALSVLHQVGPEDVTLRQLLQGSGYTFPVGTDATGSLAALYGVRSRPTDYLIGVDGRVKSSNGVPQDALLRELGMYRLGRLGRVPEALKGVRESVWRYQLGAALRDAAAAAGAATATPEAKALLDRVQALAQEDLDGRTSWGRYLVAQRRLGEARAAAEEIAAEFRGTALEAAATAARASILASVGG